MVLNDEWLITNQRIAFDRDVDSHLPSDHHSSLSRQNSVLEKSLMLRERPDAKVAPAARDIAPQSGVKVGPVRSDSPDTTAASRPLRHRHTDCLQCSRKRTRRIDNLLLAHHRHAKERIVDCRTLLRELMEEAQMQGQRHNGTLQTHWHRPEDIERRTQFNTLPPKALIGRESLLRRPAGRRSLREIQGPSTKRCTSSRQHKRCEVTDNASHNVDHKYSNPFSTKAVASTIPCASDTN